jgi:hypothetical protein
VLPVSDFRLDRPIPDFISVGTVLSDPTWGSDRITHPRDKSVLPHAAVHLHAAVDETRQEKVGTAVAAMMWSTIWSRASAGGRSRASAERLNCVKFARVEVHRTM